MLTLEWSDGYSFIPVDFSIMSSTNEENRIQELSSEINKHSCGFKRRVEAKEKKSNVAIQLINNALKQGVSADYVLMDTWFTHEPMIKEILHIGLNVFGMVKQLKQRYTYKGDSYTLSELRTLMPNCKICDKIFIRVFFLKEYEQPVVIL